MQINPLVVGGIGAAVVAGGVGLGLTKANDALIAGDPTGTKGDSRALTATIGTAFLGVAAGGALAVLGATGKIHPGFAIAGAALGAGALVGSIGAGIATQVRHGQSVESSIANVMDRYDRFPANGSLDLDGTFWRSPETFRTDTDSYEDSDGDRHTTTTVYTVQELAERADALGDGDRRTTPGELRSVIAPFDANGDGRLKGSEGRALDRAYGERVVARSSSTIDTDGWWSGGGNDDHGYPGTGTSPGDDY